MTETVINEYDATALVGLPTIVHNAVIARVDEAGEETIELPKLREAIAAATVLRCLLPIKLRGSEIKVMRKTMRMTMAELAGKLDKRTAAETVSRWESEDQPMGGYAEKLLRLLVCETLAKEAPGVEYNASMIVDLTIDDPWKAQPDYEMPPIHLELIKIREPSGSIIDAWEEAKAA